MPQHEKNQNPIRVLIVDDSTVMRAVIGKSLNMASRRVTVVGYAENGLTALEALEACNPDIVVLDLEMPVMDGLTALPLILKRRPQTRVVVCSSFSAKGAEISVRALALGAAECVLKPGGSADKKSAAEFDAALKQAVLGLGGRNPPQAAWPAVAPPAKNANIRGFRPKIIAIGSSTGGPRALISLVRELGRLPVPLVITQHIQENFTDVLARHIERETGLACHAAREGMALAPAEVYLAPGAHHLQFVRARTGVTIHLGKGPPENFCKPSVDVMLRSAVEVYGSGVLAVILTGMGSDGLKGCGQVFEAGGRILVQDQASSVVWGMPGAVANADMASLVLPLSGIARVIRRCFAETRTSPATR